MIFLDRRLIGFWGSRAAGVMETSDIVFLADGRGWSRFDGVSGELAVGRFRWYCPDAGLLHLSYTWQTCGQWGVGGEGFAAVHDSGPYDEVIETGYRLASHQQPLSRAMEPALLLDRPVEFEQVFYRDGKTVTAADDPSARLVPYPPAPRPAPPRSGSPR